MVWYISLGDGRFPFCSCYHANTLRLHFWSRHSMVLCTLYCPILDTALQCNVISTEDGTTNARDQIYLKKHGSKPTTKKLLTTETILFPVLWGPVHRHQIIQSNVELWSTKAPTYTRSLFGYTRTSSWRGVFRNGFMSGDHSCLLVLYFVLFGLVCKSQTICVDVRVKCGIYYG